VTRPTIARSRAAPWLWFAAWVIDGALFALALLGAMTIGVFVLPVALAGAVLLATRRSAAIGAGGVISGLSVPLFYVGYLNRDGPGTICRSFADGGQECREEWSPLPWLLAGLVLVIVGVVVFTAMRRARHAGPRGDARVG